MGYRKLCEKCGWYAVTEQACVCGGSACCEYTRILKERDVYFDLVLAVFDHKPTSYIEALARDIVSKFEGWFWLKHCENENGICASCFAKLVPGYKRLKLERDTLKEVANAVTAAYAVGALTGEMAESTAELAEKGLAVLRKGA